MKLAGVIEGMIESRALRPGDRVPSIRRFSAQQRVSIPTALQAYATLEARGLLEARPKSGYFVRIRQSHSVPAPRASAVASKITDFASTDPLESLMADHARADLVPLGAALPSAGLLPGVRLARTMAAIGRRLGAASVHYDTQHGSDHLRRELARHSLEWGCALEVDDFIVTVGATEAVSLALRATCEPGDTVIVESPTYFGFARMLREMRLRALPVPVDCAKGIDLDALERALRRARVSACLLIPNFHNPVGCAMPDEHKAPLIQMLAKREIPIIEDDIYGDLQHEGARPRCLKAYDAGGSVMLCSSFSKTLAPGYRVGYIAPGRWHARVSALKRASTLSGSMLPVLAVGEFLKNGGYDRHLRSIREAYRHQVDRMREAVVDSFPKGIGLSRPRGGFLLWCELPEEVDSMRLFTEARAAGISIAPGPFFSPDGRFKNFIRINCGYPWDARIERAVGVLGHLVRRMADG